MENPSSSTRLIFQLAMFMCGLPTETVKEVMDFIDSMYDDQPSRITAGDIQEVADKINNLDHPEKQI